MWHSQSDNEILDFALLWEHHSAGPPPTTVPAPSPSISANVTTDSEPLRGSSWPNFSTASHPPSTSMHCPRLRCLTEMYRKSALYKTPRP